MSNNEKHSEGPYTVHDIDDDWQNLLKGPGGFECDLGESCDRTWNRDMAPVVAKLNEQHAQNAELIRAVGEMRVWLETEECEQASFDERSMALYEAATRLSALFDPILAKARGGGE